MPRSRPASWVMPSGRSETVIARELARHHHQLLVIEGLMDGLAVLGVDARPDDVAVLAPLLDVKDDRPRLAGEVELRLGAIDVVEILRAGQLALRRVGIDREAVEIIAAAGHRMGADFPLGERAMQVAGDGAAHLGDLDIFVVVGVLQVGGEVLPHSALAGLGDHGFLPRALKQAARISVRERTASSIASAVRPGLGSVRCDGMERVAHLGESGENLRDRLMLDGGAAGPARRIGAGPGFGDEGGGGEAGCEHAPFEFRPQLFGRAV